jgi:hypothetical protein
MLTLYRAKGTRPPSPRSTAHGCGNVIAETLADVCDVLPNADPVLEFREALRRLIRAKRVTEPLACLEREI